MSKKFKLITLFMAILLVIIIPFGIMMNNTSSSQNNIFKGVYVNGVNVGNMSKDEAVKILNDKFNKDIMNKKIVMNYEGNVFTIDYNFLKAHYDVDNAVNEALSYGKKGNLIIKTINRLRLKKAKHDINMNFVADTTSVAKEIKKISNRLNVVAKDAVLSFNGGKFRVTSEHSGKKVNEEKLNEMIKKSIKPDGKEDKIQIPVEVVEAKIKSDMLSNVSTRISSFTTKFSVKSTNRVGNIKIATNTINGTILMPGEVFSMLKTLGPRVKSQGYTEAPVIVNGTLVPGLAGGICQVSSTLYNTALFANLQIVERRQHGLKVSYVDAGRDATLSGNSIDLKFKNIYKYPIYIQAFVNGGSVTVNMYGANEKSGQRVVIYSDVYETIEPKIQEIPDSSLETGKRVYETKPAKGYKSRTYRKVYENGKLVKTELLSRDTYKATNGKVKVGTKPVSKPQTPIPVEPIPTKPAQTQ